MVIDIYAPNDLLDAKKRSNRIKKNRIHGTVKLHKQNYRESNSPYT